MSDLFELDGEASPKEAHRKVMLTPKRRAILSVIRQNETITLDEAVALIGGDIYANERFHVGNILSAMVNAGLIRRIKPGLFAKA